MKTLDLIILILSLSMSLGVAAYSIALTWRNGLDRRLYSIPLALMLMFGRRVAPFLDTLSGNESELSVDYDLVGLAISLLTLVGLLAVARLAKEKAASYGRIESLLEEKNLILREVHHRMKNNMLAVKALLSLQAMELSDPIATKAFEDTGSRLDSMMLLYDQLYRSGSFLETSAKSYLTLLVRHVFENFPATTPVTVETSIDDFTLDAKRLQEVGIIVNELVTNSMKYAFKGRSGGVLTVEARSRDGRVTVIVQDDGNGIPAGMDVGHSPGFGMRLVEGLVKQLRGRTSREDGDGTRIILDFPM